MLPIGIPPITRETQCTVAIMQRMIHVDMQCQLSKWPHIGFTAADERMPGCPPAMFDTSETLCAVGAHRHTAKQSRVVRMQAVCRYAYWSSAVPMYSAFGHPHPLHFGQCSPFSGRRSGCMRRGLSAPGVLAGFLRRYDG